MRSGTSACVTLEKAVLTQRFCRCHVFLWMTVPQIAYNLQKRLDRDMLIRVGWGQYALPGKTVYSYEYSEEAVDVAQWIEKEFDGLDFRVFELVQLNDFINHQIAHNTILWQQKTTLLTSLLTACGKRIPEGLCWSLRQISITDIIRIMTWLLGDFLQNLQRAFAIRGKADWKKSWWMCLHVNYSPESTI